MEIHYNLSNNPSSSLMTQIASQTKKKKKKKSKQTKYETEIHESKGTKPRNRKFLN